MIKSLDHELYERYRKDPEPHEFQKNYIQWYETGGKSRRVWSNRLRKYLKTLSDSGVSIDEIHSYVKKFASKNTLISSRSRCITSETTAENLCRTIKRNFSEYL